MKPRLTTLLVALWLVLMSVTGIAAQTPASQNAIGTQAALGTNFVYQGFLNSSNTPATGAFDFEFTLYDAPTGGTLLGTFPANNQTVSNGLFTVMIDFGPSAFNGSARFMQIKVRPAGTGNLVPLSPRVELAAVPNAQFSSSTGGLQGRPVSGAAPTTSQVLQWNGSQWVPASVSVPVPLNLSGSVAFPAGVISGTNSGNGSGIRGESSAADGTGVHGIANTGTDAYGVWGTSTTGSGVAGYSTNSDNPAGSFSSAAVLGIGTGPKTIGAEGYSESRWGVLGLQRANNDTWWFWNGHIGVLGASGDGYGVYGSSNSSIGVYGFTNNSNSYAGYFDGRVHATGGISSGAAAIVSEIDHPLDPTNQILRHSAVESPDMKNIYDGVVTLDANGAAVVELPTYFQALNQEFRYQLTCIGGFAQIYIDQEIANNRFSIAGGKPGLKVSWQVTGVRHDPGATINRLPVEENKPDSDRGTYIQPSAYGQPDTLGVDFARNRQSELNQAMPQKGR
jgi:hypothetical protein